MNAIPSQHPPIVFESAESWESSEITDLYLKAALPDDEIRLAVRQVMQGAGLKATTISQLVTQLRTVMRDSMDWSAPVLNTLVIRGMEMLSQYESNLRTSWEAYDLKSKPNPAAVFWPNKERGANQDIFKILPVVKNLEWVGRETKVASAGSCFASEISYALQKRGFNYLIAEKMIRPEEGVAASDFDNETKLQGSSANWGILFNAPSFRQLAEAAFEVKKFKPLLFRIPSAEGPDVYTYPYREAVFFRDPASFVADHPKHLEAARKVFLTSDVFVITLGLNECWQFMDDGTFMARNPRFAVMNSLVKPRVLSFEENRESVQGFIDLVRHHNPQIKFVITVSPVPLLATHQAHRSHIIAANGHSKAMLRIVAEEICKTNTHCAYFPSYELILYGVDRPWEPDGRHITRDAVGRVMKLFDASFVPSKDQMDFASR